MNKEQMKESEAYGTNGTFTHIKAYRNQFWVLEPGRTFAQDGIHGQRCYIDTELDLVIVKHASSLGSYSNDWDFLDKIAS